MFNEATQNIYKISFDEKYTEKRVISVFIVQADIGSTKQVSSPKFLICAHQTQNSLYVPKIIIILLYLIMLICVNNLLKKMANDILETVYLWIMKKMITLNKINVQNYFL